MSNKNADILQVEKYLAGELDALAMHELERRALADPFLYDALEGHGKAGMTNANMEELNLRLQQRIASAKVRRLNFNVIAMAASIVVILTLGGIWIVNKTTPEKTSFTLADKTSVTQSPLADKPEILFNKDSLLALNKPVTTFNRPQSHRSLSKPTELTEPSLARMNNAPLAFSIETDEGNHAPAPAIDNRDSVPLDEMLVMGMAKAKKEDMQAVNKSITGRLAGVASRQSVKDNVISGKVVNGQDGTPLPGVSVNIEGTNKIAQTDAQGVFKIPADSTATDVKLNYVGFNSKSAKMTPGASLSVIVMEPVNSSLNEVVVVGYGASKKRKVSAQPRDGWKLYQQYLNDNAVSPDGKEATVRVSFSVSPDGSLNGLETNAGKNNELQQKAIEFIENGPDWIGNSNGKVQKVTVKIKFHKAN